MLVLRDRLIQGIAAGVRVEAEVILIIDRLGAHKPLVERMAHFDVDGG